MLRQETEAVASIPWSRFLSSELDWHQGEHVTIIGPTGQGKTFLALRLLALRRYPLVLAAKPRDPLIAALRPEGYKLVRSWPPPPPEIEPRILFWPHIEEAADITAQREQFRRALLGVYRAGGYAVYLDEINYLTQFLRLAPIVELLYRQGRTLDVSMIGGTQRPFHVPLLAYDQATHLFFFRDSDAVNYRRLGSLGGSDSKRIIANVVELSSHEFLYLHTRSGRLVRSQVTGTG